MKEKRCNMKEKRCKGYCGVACVDGHCPIALYNEDFTMFEKSRLATIAYITKVARIVVLRKRICAPTQPRKAVRNDIENQAVILQT